MVIYDRLASEAKRILESFRMLAAFEPGEDWDCAFDTAEDRFFRLLESGSVPALCCLDVAEGPTVAEKTRRRVREVLLILITELGMPPTVYMKPSIMAAGLLLRPLDEKQMERTMREVFEVLRDREREAAFEGAAFTLEDRSGVTKVPYAEILYFEAREKKIFLSTRYAEQSFYSTLEALEKQLPPAYLRCHKSFIVNLRAVTKASAPEHLLVLSGGARVPVSRSYRAAVREALT
jgi:DNA-binding LytR/AlgR family response regulator